MTEVSRETPPAPPAPPGARGVFGERLGLAERYAASLASDGVVRGLIGPREAPRLWSRHLMNCGLLAHALPEAGTVCDVGSGAGLPGLVLAIARPSLQVTLVEPLLRRTTYLAEVVEQLDLDNVEVVRGRAEALHGQRTFDVVTGRAVAPLPRLLAWTMPLVAPDGVLVAMKGSSVEREIAEAEAELARLRCSDPEVQRLGEGDDAVTVVRVSWADPRQVRLPGASTTGSGPRAGGPRRRGGAGARRR